MSKTTIKKANGLVMEVDSDAAVAYAFHQAEALGEITIRPCAFGLEVLCPAVDPDRPIALIDLHPQSVKGRTAEEDPLVQILVHAPTKQDEAIARFRYFPVRTQA